MEKITLTPEILATVKAETAEYTNSFDLDPASFATIFPSSVLKRGWDWDFLATNNKKEAEQCLLSDEILVEL